MATNGRQKQKPQEGWGLRRRGPEDDAQGQGSIIIMVSEISPDLDRCATRSCSCRRGYVARQPTTVGGKSIVTE